MNIHHDEGILFMKHQADTGITYLAVEADEVDQMDTRYLVRHGNPNSGRCGYYPAHLIFSTKAAREHAAWKSCKTPPDESWVSYVREVLLDFAPQLQKK